MESPLIDKRERSNEAHRRVSGGRHVGKGGGKVDNQVFLCLEVSWPMSPWAFIRARGGFGERLDQQTWSPTQAPLSLADVSSLRRFSSDSLLVFTHGDKVPRQNQHWIPFPLSRCQSLPLNNRLRLKKNKINFFFNDASSSIKNRWNFPTFKILLFLWDEGTRIKIVSSRQQKHLKNISYFWNVSMDWKLYPNFSWDEEQRGQVGR